MIKEKTISPLTIIRLKRVKIRKKIALRKTIIRGLKKDAKQIEKEFKKLMMFPEVPLGDFGKPTREKIGKKKLKKSTKSKY